MRMRDPTQAPEAASARAQQDIVAAILLDNDLFDRLALTRAHFTDPHCQRIFASAVELIEKGERADEITVERR
jgi:replicative DNA helicase